MTIEVTSLLNGRVQLRQQKGGLRASTDTVLLASIVNAIDNDSILDMGCGTGGAGLCVLERLKSENIHLTGIDIQSDLIELAKKNASSHCFVCSDITADKHIFQAEEFDHILMNPPYFETGKKQPNMDYSRDLAFSHNDLDVWMKHATHWVKQGGSVNLIHKADALYLILKLADKRFGAIEIWPVYSKMDKPAIRILVRMFRNRKTPLKIHPPVILYDQNGKQTLQSYSILRDGKTLLD
jgi:tRNA1(Val) A37 N6-methylase TrmN6